MAKFCTYCGSPLEDNAEKCDYCGVKTDGAPEPVKETVTPVQPVIKEDPKPVYTPPVQPQPVQPQVQYSQPVQPQYTPKPTQPQYAAPAPAATQNKIASTAFYFWMTLVFSLPIVGFITSIICSICYKNKSKKNFSKAFMLWYIVGIVCALVVFIGLLILGAVMGASLAEILNDMYGSGGGYYPYY